MKRSTILLAALLATTACTQSTSSQPAGSLAGVDQSLIDKSVKPGDDFNAYASGAWAAKTEIPADRSSVGVGFDVFKVAEARNRELIEGAAKAMRRPEPTSAGSQTIIRPIRIPPESRSTAWRRSRPRSIRSRR